MSDEDREAVRRVQAGETEAFEVLVEKYRRKTFRLAFQVLRDQEEALDVAQEAFVKAFRSLPRFKGDSAFYTWLFRITMNLALDRRRQRASRAQASSRSICRRSSRTASRAASSRSTPKITWAPAGHAMQP